MLLKLSRLAMCGALVGGLLSSCEEPARSNARRVATRADLIGGPSALGEVGDFLLENEKIRVIIQDKGFSRGFGVFGGSLIDADIVRPVAAGDSSGGKGRDQFGELFPAAFLQGLVPDKVEIVNDGSDGEEAIVRVSGEGGDFLSLTKVLNQAVLNSHRLPESPLDVFNVGLLDGDPTIGYEVFYGLKPGDRYLRITVRMTNLTDEPLKIPSLAGQAALGVLDVPVAEFQAPLGLVTLFGAGNNVFVPGAGYGLRFALEEAYSKGTAGRCKDEFGEDVRVCDDERPCGDGQRCNADGKCESSERDCSDINPCPSGQECSPLLKFPALPGLLTPAMVSSSATGISYGLVASPDDETNNFVKNRLGRDGENIYESIYGVDVDDDTMLIPFVASSFTALYFAQTPNQLGVGAENAIEYSLYFVVGDGDIASVMDVAYDLRNDATALLTGTVRDALSGDPRIGASVLIYKASNDGTPQGSPVNQFYADQHGRIRGHLPSGDYAARVLDHDILSEPVAFSIVAGEPKNITLAASTPGELVVNVRDPSGRPLPAKVTIVGTVPPERSGEPASTFLFDLASGEHWRPVDLVPDDPDDPETRRYIERFGYSEDGRAVLMLKPDIDWSVVVSRGIEYDTVEMEVNVAAGQRVVRSATLRRSVDTAGYVSADFHLHAKPSLDSSMPLDERVLSIVAEGVEVLTSTDHNFITDYAPTIEQLRLNDWATSMIGLELTTLESGHFNGYPLRREVGATTKGAFEWSLRPPDELFAELRELGAHGPENVIIQVNHPRDTILGYFEQYDLDPITAGLPEAPDCSFLSALDNPYGCIIPPNGPAFRTVEGESTFSYEFDAIEVFNAAVHPSIGQFHHLRMPETLEGLEVSQDFLDNAPPAGSVLCDGDTIAVPGSADDWFNLLNLGYRYIGTGTSDSHDADDHPGAGRSYVYVGDDDPSQISSLDLVRAMKSRRVVMTSGPFVEFSVNDAFIGSDVSVEEGRATLKVSVQVANWFTVTEGVVWGNGRELLTFPIQIQDGKFEWEETVELVEDTWLVVEVKGGSSMFPIHRPSDRKPLLIEDVLVSVVEPLFGESALGELGEQRIGQVLPLAITNPIWVDVDGDTDGRRSRGCDQEECSAFEAPGPRIGRCEDYRVVYEKSRVSALELAPAVTTPSSALHKSFGFPKLRGDVLDVRTIFDQFGRHAH